MEWSTPFVVYRVSSEGKLEEVYHAVNMKKAKYWLTYIAQPGDVCCRTPVHPKHSQASAAPEYWGHKESSGTTSTNREAWQEENQNVEEFPNEQLMPSDSF